MNTSCRARPDESECLLDVLAAAERKAFANISRRIAYPNGSVLFRAGEGARGVLLLRRGKVKLSASGTGGEIAHRVAGPGEVLGLSEALADTPYGVTAEVISPSQADFVERKDFLGFLHRHPETCFKVVEVLSLKLSAAQEHMRVFGPRRPASGNLMQLLLTS